MKASKYKYIIVLLIVVLALLTFFTYDIIQTYRDNLKLYKEIQKYIFSKNDPSKRANGTSFIGDPFLDFELVDLNGNTWKLWDIHATLKVIILFSTYDCSKCLLEYRLWKEIDNRYPDEEIMVLGINHGNEMNEILLFVEERDIKFPIFHDSNSIVKQGMGFRQSPLRIILDKDNKIIDVSETNAQLEKQKEVLKKLQNLLDASFDKKKQKN